MMNQDDAKLLAERLGQKCAEADAAEIIRTAAAERPGRMAILSSFGAESAIMLAIAADIDRSLPVVFIDTGKLFPETLAYRDELVSMLGLSDLRIVGPAVAEVETADPEGILWYWDSDRCCALRKVAPLDAAVGDFDIVISGRKRYHGALRRFLSRFEAVDGRVKVDPLAYWDRERVEAEMERRGLPRHPLVGAGYASIGCAPCTVPVQDGDDMRSGRWSGNLKTECGIHLARA